MKRSVGQIREITMRCKKIYEEIGKLRNSMSIEMKETCHLEEEEKLILIKREDLAVIFSTCQKLNVAFVT